MTASADELTVQRRSGVALWRQIADRIRAGAAAGLADESGRLPPEVELAARFGVNRHTVRAAIAALVGEGALRAEQGRGTFVVRRKRLSYPIARRTRFSAGLESQTVMRGSRLLGHAREIASSLVADGLAIDAGAQVIRLDILGEADGTPVSRSTSWFDAARFAGIETAYAKALSVSAALAELGVPDYLRRSTCIEARHASAEDTSDLNLSPGAIVLVTRAINTDVTGKPIQYSQTRFAADRVELQVHCGA